jgi:hypothetical protein
MAHPRSGGEHEGLWHARRYQDALGVVLLLLSSALALVLFPYVCECQKLF